MTNNIEGAENETAIALIAQAVLRRGKSLQALSLIILSASVLMFLSHASTVASTGLFTAALFLGAAEYYFALRVALDADFFGLLGSQKLTTAQFDAAMVKFRLMDTNKTGRGMEVRAKGAFRLLRAQFACLIAQGVTLLCAAALFLFL